MKPNKGSMLFIGITGGIGAGKSEILRYLGRHYKCQIYLADEVAHQVKLPGTKCYDSLVSLLGEEILETEGQKAGRINHKAMAERIFGDPKLLRQVNAIVHPAVKEYLLEHLEAARRDGETELFFVEAALLIETGYGELVDEMWYVYAGEEVRVRRLMETRGYSEEKIARIMANQLSEEAFRGACNFVIDNSGDLADSYRKIDKKLEAYTWRE